MQTTLELNQHKNIDELSQFVAQLEERRAALLEQSRKIESFFTTLEELRKELSLTLTPLDTAAEYRLLTKSVLTEMGIQPNKYTVNAWGQAIPPEVQRFKILEVTGRKTTNYVKPIWFPIDGYWSAKLLRENYLKEDMESLIWIAEATIINEKVHTYRRRKAKKLLEEGWQSEQEVLNYVNNVKFKELEVI